MELIRASIHHAREGRLLAGLPVALAVALGVGLVSVVAAGPAAGPLLEPAVAPGELGEFGARGELRMAAGPAGERLYLFEAGAGRLWAFGPEGRLEESLFLAGPGGAPFAVDAGRLVAGWNGFAVAAGGWLTRFDRSGSFLGRERLGATPEAVSGALKPERVQAGSRGGPTAVAGALKPERVQAGSRGGPTAVAGALKPERVQAGLAAESGPEGTPQRPFRPLPELTPRLVPRDRLPVAPHSPVSDVAWHRASGTLLVLRSGAAGAQLERFVVGGGEPERFSLALPGDAAPDQLAVTAGAVWLRGSAGDAPTYRLDLEALSPSPGASETAASAAPGW